jgi:hypothetical protein
MAGITLQRDANEMKKFLALSAMAAAMVLSACATGGTTAATEQVSQREYPTGSSIPRKRAPGEAEGVQTYDREAIDRARDQMPSTARPGLGGTQ